MGRRDFVGGGEVGVEEESLSGVRCLKFSRLCMIGLSN